MPTYEYECSKCRATYELRQGFDAETTHPCEECGTGVAKRILHAPRVVFKGSGWYATDSRKSQSAVSDTGNSPSASESEGAGSDKKESASKESPPKEKSASAETAAAG